MKQSTYRSISHERKSAADTTHSAALTIPGDTSAVLITVETTSARVTFDGSDPTAASAPSIVFPKDSLPVLVPVGPGTTITFCSTAGAAAVLQALYLS